MTEHFGLVDLGSKTLILAGALDFAFRVFVTSTRTLPSPAGDQCTLLRRVDNVSCRSCL